jgi:hypothetical protein
MKGELRRSALCNIPTHLFVDVKRPVQISVSLKNEMSVKFIKHEFRSHIQLTFLTGPNFTAQNKKSLTSFVVIKVYQ